MTYDLEMFKPLQISRAPAERQDVTLTVTENKFRFSYKARNVLHFNRIRVMYDGHGTYAFVGCVDGPLKTSFHSKELRLHMAEERGYGLPMNFKWYPDGMDKQKCALFFSVLEVGDELQV